MYLIVYCPHCGKLMMANSANRTRQCPHCNHRAETFTLRVLARAESPRDAVEIIQRLKEEKRGGKGSPRFKKFSS